LRVTGFNLIEHGVEAVHQRTDLVAAVRADAKGIVAGFETRCICWARFSMGLAIRRCSRTPAARQAARRPSDGGRGQDALVHQVAQGVRSK
jgi:hypothetical protein